MRRVKTPRIQNLLNSFVSGGSKKNIVDRVWDVLRRSKSHTPASPLLFLDSQFLQVRPLINFTPKKIAGVSCRIPTPFRGDRGLSVAFNWFRSSLRNRGTSLVNSFYSEILDLVSGRSKIFKARDEHHRQVVANKHFVRYLKKRRKRLHE